jgi:20S proteasome alpha/beta subunit
MTVIVSVKIDDGVVLAVDSAGSMESGQIMSTQTKSPTYVQDFLLARCPLDRAASVTSQSRLC